MAPECKEPILAPDLWHTDRKVRSGMPARDKTSRSVAANRGIILPYLVAGIVFVLLVGAAPASAVSISASDSPGQTAVTKNLNKKLKKDKSGLLIRALPDDNIVNGLAVASWTRNDIEAPTSLYVVQGYSCGAGIPAAEGYYPDGQPYSPTTFIFADAQKCADPLVWPGEGKLAGKDAYTYGQVGLVVDKPGKFTTGTFYPTDSNAINARDKVRGRGCHPKQEYGQPPGSPGSLVANEACQCNTGLSGRNWQDWIDAWITGAFQTTGTYFSGNQPQLPFTATGGVAGKAPMFAFDFASCWFDNANDMVGLQNALWRSRGQWWNGLIPMQPKDVQGITDPDGMKYYGGWNELPVKESIDDGDGWAAAMLKLPAGTDSIKELSRAARKNLKKQLLDMLEIKQYGLKVGSKKRGKIAILTEQFVGGSNDKWKRKFVCQNHSFGKKLSISYQPKSKKKDGYCYLSD